MGLRRWPGRRKRRATRRLWRAGLLTRLQARAPTEDRGFVPGRRRLKAKVHLLIVVASDLAEMPQISRPHTLAGPWLRGCSAQEASQTGGSCHPVGVAMALDTTRLGAISPQLDMEGQEVTLEIWLRSPRTERTRVI